MLRQVSIDGGLEVDNAAEYAALEATLREDGEKAFDGVEAGGGCRREVEDKTPMTCQPFDDLRVLMGGVVVEDHVDDLADRNLRLDLIEEANELLVSMPCMHCPIIEPSSTLSAAKSVVVPWRL